MRLVLDTNTVVSGLLWNGAEHALLAAAGVRSDVALYSSPPLLAELAEVLSRPRLATAVAASGLTPDMLMYCYLDVVVVVAPADIAPVVLADPDDDQVLACALAARADFVVSGDSDLRNLKSYQGIPIVAAAEGLRRIALTAGRM